MPWSPNWHDDVMTELKPAEEWIKDLSHDRIHWFAYCSCSDIRHIQANALRWAADRNEATGLDIEMITLALRVKADQLESTNHETPTTPPTAQPPSDGPAN
jgi:hypothetical protein